MDIGLFEQIYHQYADGLLRYALSYGCDIRQSEEIVQDVFLSLWERRHRLAIEGDAKQYLYKSVKYKIFDHYRNEAKKQLALEELRLSACDSLCFTEQEVTFNEVQKLLGHAVEKLPCRCREVYEMSRGHGLPNRDIAKKLAISEKTVEQHLTKALKYIRQVFKPTL